MNTDNNVFGIRLKSLRLNNNEEHKAQKDFAKYLGIPQPTLSAYECGKIKPTVEALINIADKCNVSIDWLLGRNDKSQINSLGDIMSCISELYETNEITIQTTIQDNIDLEDDEEIDDKKRNWVNLRIYFCEAKRNPKANLNSSLCDIIKKAFKLSSQLRNYECDQDYYNHEKEYYINEYNNFAITKINHSDISEDERRRKMFENLKREMK